jgi:hypothetical protein
VLAAVCWLVGNAAVAVEQALGTAHISGVLAADSEGLRRAAGGTNIRLVWCRTRSVADT